MSSSLIPFAMTYNNWDSKPRSNEAVVRSHYANFHTLVQLVSQKNKTSVYTTFDADEPSESNSEKRVAVKTFDAKNPTDAEEAGFYREFDVHSKLKGKASVRATLERGDYEGRRFMHFAWAEGPTLREWITSAHNSTSHPRCNLEGAPQGSTRMALAATRALAQLHDAGFAHNNFGADHIVLTNHTQSITLIGLSSTKRFLQPEAPGIIRDLIHLGMVLYEIYTGEQLEFDMIRIITPCSSNGSIGERNKSCSMQSNHARAVHPLFSSAVKWSTVPGYIKDLVSGLLGVGVHAFSYKAVKQVEEDLVKYVHFLDSLQEGPSNDHINTVAPNVDLCPSKEDCQDLQEVGETSMPPTHAFTAGTAVGAKVRAQGQGNIHEAPFALDESKSVELRTRLLALLQNSTSRQSGTANAPSTACLRAKHRGCNQPKSPNGNEQFVQKEEYSSSASSSQCSGAKPDFRELFLNNGIDIPQGSRRSIKSPPSSELLKKYQRGKRDVCYVSRFYHDEEQRPKKKQRLFEMGEISVV